MAAGAAGIRAYFNTLSIPSLPGDQYAFAALLLIALLLPLAIAVLSPNRTPRSWEPVVVPLAVLSAYVSVQLLSNVMGEYSFLVAIGFAGVAYVSAADQFVRFLRSKRWWFVILTLVLAVPTAWIGFLCAWFIAYFE